MVARIFAVMALVLAALVSSWIGIDAGQYGRETVTEALRLARRVLDARSLANELVARQAEFVLEALRTKGAVAAAREYRRTFAELRQALEEIGRFPLEQRERTLLAAVHRQVEYFDQVNGEISALIQRATRADELAASAKVLEIAVPLADDVAARIRALGATAVERAERTAEEAGVAAERARVLLVAFAGLSLLVALLLAHSLGDAMAKSAELVRQFAELARVDVLTGLPNRRAWDEELVKGLHRARRTGLPCAVAMIDLDHFKRFNDTFGHRRGDALLRVTAQALAARLRAGDLIARYGGEEFAVLLHGCDAGNAVKFFERLHRAAPEGQTFSAGVTESDGREEDGEVVQRADDALYRAKAGGRNRTVVSGRSTATA